MNGAADGALLLDVNLLIALFDPAHVHHDLAHDWFEDNRARGWATCSATENGFLRVLSNPAYPGGGTRCETLVGLLKKFRASGHHHYWADAVSLADPSLFNVTWLRGHRQVTDVHLLGLAWTMRGRLATFDRTIPWKAIVGGQPELLEVISPAD